MRTLTPAQMVYTKSIQNFERPITVCVGPAGCGKTQIACVEALGALYGGDVKKLVISRPAQTVDDEEFGFLPGTIDDKFEPWIKPIIDHVGMNEIRALKRHNKLEISPLAYMRGRTFIDSFVLADEMQNCSDNQLKMILTRIGYGSKMVLTGDPMQCDVDHNGLNEFVRRASEKDLEYVDVVRLTGSDIHRHPAVREVIDIYES